MSQHAAIRRAIEIFGSEEKLARATKYSQRAIHHAKATGHVSPLMAYRIHAATKRRVSLTALCPLLDVQRQLRLAHKQVANGARL